MSVNKCNVCKGTGRVFVDILTGDTRQCIKCAPFIDPSIDAKLIDGDLITVQEILKQTFPKPAPKLIPWKV